MEHFAEEIQEEKIKIREQRAVDGEHNTNSVCADTGRQLAISGTVDQVSLRLGRRRRRVAPFRARAASAAAAPCARHGEVWAAVTSSVRTPGPGHRPMAAASLCPVLAARRGPGRLRLLRARGQARSPP